MNSVNISEFDYKTMESVSTDSIGKLVGGFSMTFFNGKHPSHKDNIANNCLGANCTPGCDVIGDGKKNEGCNSGCFY